MKTSIEIQERNKPNKDGKEFINAICFRLKDTDKLSTDSNIVRLIETLTNAELNQLIGLGNITEWHKDYLNT